MNLKSPILNKLFVSSMSMSTCFLILLLTDPKKIALPFLMVPFLLIGITLYSLTRALLRMRQTEATKTAKDRLISLSVALIGVGLLVLQTLHQLSWRDTLLVILFIALLWLYVGRADFLKK